MVANWQAGNDLTQGLDAGAAIQSAANGAVVGAVTGATLGVGTALFGTAVAWNSVETVAISTMAGPLGAAAGIAFKGLTGQEIGPADALGAFSNMIPLPPSQRVAIPIGVFIDQILSALSGQIAGPAAATKSQVLR